MIFKIAYEAIGCYMIADPMAVAVAFEPEIVEEYFEKRCFIET